METRSKIPMSSRRIQWYVMPEPPATLQGAAIWRIQCHDPKAIHVTLQGAATERI